MFTRRDIFRLASASAGSVLLGSALDLPAHADGTSWPPTAINQGDDPYGSGNFRSNGRTYHIDYVDVVNTAVSPVDPQVKAGPAIALVSGYNNDVTQSFSNKYTYDSSSYDPINHWWGTNFGSTKGNTSGLWRIVAIYGETHCFIEDPATSASGQVTGSSYPVLRYKITATNPVSNSFDATIRIANGVSQIGEKVFWWEAPTAPGSGTAHGSYPSNTLTASVSSGGPNHDEKLVTNYRSIDSFQQSRITNGIGYFYLQIPMNISGTLNQSVPWDIPGIARAQGAWEVVPIQVVGP